MKPELKTKILAFNRQHLEKAEKASDMDILISEILKLPQGQLKKVLSPAVIAILEKYGVNIA